MTELTPEDAAFIAAMDAIEAEAQTAFTGFATSFREATASFAEQVKDRINGSRDASEIRATVAGAEAEEIGQ